MFGSQLSEAATNRVEIVDFDADIVKHFVDYIQTGRVTAELNADDSVELLRMADKYDVEGLRKLAIDCIVPQLSLTNIAAIFNLAMSLQDVDELNRACGMFLANNLPQVKEAKLVESLSSDAKNFFITKIC